MIERDTFIQKFAKKCKEDNAAIFLGAGMSVDAGLPSWKDLFAPLAQELQINILKLLNQNYGGEGTYTTD